MKELQVMTEKIEKLPKWAQDHIRSMEIELRALRKSVAKVPKTNTRWGWPNQDMGNAVGYIPDDEAVRFTLNSDYEWIEIRRKNGKLLLYGSHGLVLGPTSSNMALITVDRDSKW